MGLGFRSDSPTAAVYFSTHWGCMLPSLSLNYLFSRPAQTWSSKCREHILPSPLHYSCGLHHLLINISLNPTDSSPLLSGLCVGQQSPTLPHLLRQSTSHAYHHQQIPSIFSISETQDGQDTTQEQPGHDSALRGTCQTSIRKEQASLSLRGARPVSPTTEHLTPAHPTTAINMLMLN